MNFKIKKNDIVIANRASLANTIVERVIGLMFSKDLGTRDALIIDPCRSIHTFFMNYPIDVVFLSSKNKVIKVIRHYRPWRVSWIYFRATKVIEFMEGTLSLEVQEGDQLDIECIS